MIEITAVELIESFSVDWSKFQQKYYGQGELNINGFKVKFKTDYFDRFDDAAQAAKGKVTEAIQKFYSTSITGKRITE